MPIGTVRYGGAPPRRFPVVKSGDHADRGRVTRGCVADVNVAALRLLSELRTTAPYFRRAVRRQLHARHGQGLPRRREAFTRTAGQQQWRRPVGGCPSKRDQIKPTYSSAAERAVNAGHERLRILRSWCRFRVLLSRLVRRRPACQASWFVPTPARLKRSMRLGLRECL